MTGARMTGTQVALALAIVQQAQRMVNEGTAPYGMLQAVRAFNAVAKGVPTTAITPAWRAYPVPRRIVHYLRETGGSWTCGEISQAVSAEHGHVRRTLSSLVRDGFVVRTKTTLLPRFSVSTKAYESRASVSPRVADIMEQQRRPLRASEIVTAIGSSHSPVLRALRRMVRRGIATRSTIDGIHLYTLAPSNMASRSATERP